MMQHILHWTYKYDVPEEERTRIETELAALPNHVPSLRGLQWGPVIGGRNHTFTHTFVMLFNDAQGLHQYTVHPAHVRFAGPFREACAEQMVVDFEEGV
jgi:hypothetical protein